MTQTSTTTTTSNGWKFDYAYADGRAVLVAKTRCAAPAGTVAARHLPAFGCGDHRVPARATGNVDAS